MVDYHNHDPFSEKLFEMRLYDIYKKHSWLSYEISQEGFVKLFPVNYKKGRAILPDKPVGFDLDKSVFLEVLVAFRQSF